MPQLLQTIRPTEKVAKGLYLDWERDLIPEGGMIDGQNVETNERGAMLQVPGWSKFSTTAPPGTAPVMLLGDFVNAAGTRRLMCCTTTRLSRFNVGTLVFDDNTGGANLLTGAATNPIFSSSLTDLFILTNGVNAIKKSNGTSWADLAGSPPLALGLDVYEGHVIVWNVTEAGTNTGFRYRTSDLNLPETWSGGEAATFDLRDENTLPILAGGKMRRQFLFYKQDLGGIFAVTYVGLPLVMTNEMLFPRMGILAPKALAIHRDTHFFLGSDEQIYMLAPGWLPQPIGDPVRKRLYKKLNYTNRNAVWATVNPLRQQVIFAIPEGTATYASRAYIYNLASGTWGERELAMASGTFVNDPRTTTIDALTGTVNALTGNINDLSAQAKNVFLVGGGGTTNFAYLYDGLTTIDGTNIDAWATTRVVGSSGLLQMRLRGVEAETQGGPNVEALTLATIDGVPTYTQVASVAGGRVDTNVSGGFVGARFRTLSGTPWELTGYRLDTWRQGRR